MRATSLIPVMIAITLSATPAGAGSLVIKVDAPNEASQPTTEADFEKYRGYMYDLSEYAGRKDATAITDNLKHQLDMVENAGFSPRVLEFFHTIPIVASETDCLELGAGIACYGPVAPTRRRHALLSCFHRPRVSATGVPFVDSLGDLRCGRRSAAGPWE